MNEEQTSHLSLRAAYPFGADHGLQEEINDIRGMFIASESFHTPTVRRGYIVDLFEKHGIFDEFNAKHWVNGRTPEGERKSKYYIRSKEKYEEFLAGKQPEIAISPAEDELEQDADQQFASESDLRDFLAKNLGLIEPGLRLYQTSNRSGVEFPIERGYIDILAVDRNQRFVVIELKVGRGRNKAVGQLAYYMGWVDKNLGNGPCRGMIVAKGISDDLILATQPNPGVSLYRYSLSVSIEPVSAKP